MYFVCQPYSDEITIQSTVDPTAANDKVHKHIDIGKHVSKYIFYAENEVISVRVKVVLNYDL